MARSDKGKLAKKNIAKKSRARISVAVFHKDEKGRYTDRSFTLSLLWGLLVAFSPIIVVLISIALVIAWKF